MIPRLPNKPTRPTRKQTGAKGVKTPRATQDLFCSLVRSDIGVDCVKEYQFHPKRKWRFDYAMPEYRIAIEIDGGVWTYGRHNRAAGYLGDMEKFNEAATMGWLVLKFQPQTQYNRATFNLIRETVETCRKLRISAE